MGHFSIEEFVFCVQRGRFRVLPAKGAAGKFLQIRTMGAKHEFVQPYLIQPKMEQLLESYRNSTEHIIPRLVRVHIEFEGIHPFIDGKVTLRHRQKVM